MLRTRLSPILRLMLPALAAALLCAGCGSRSDPPPAGAQPGAAISPDCTAPASALSAGVTRVYIALRNGVDGSGLTADDARDGSTPVAFDTILRCYAEGCASRAVPPTDDLIVCLGPGTFQTMGNYDANLTQPHVTPNGFTLNAGWKIHGQGPDRTTVQLSAFLPITDPGNHLGLPVGTGVNVVFATRSHTASGIEISDLTIDANYPGLKPVADDTGTSALNLEAIHLWSARGHNWLHNLLVIHAAGEIGAADETHESFIVMLNNASPNNTPGQSTGNLIENVTLAGFGGGNCTAIAVGNSVAEVRNNRVDGYQIAYGGWLLTSADFHDNVANGSTYGFNFDTFSNQGVRIANNQLSPVHGFGMVIGGGSAYTHFTITGNTVRITDSTTFGLLFQGGVSNSVVTGNTITGGGAGAVGILNYSYGPLAGGVNANNVYQSNTIDAGLIIFFAAPSALELNCAFGNRDQHGNPLPALPDTTSTPCIP